jgi:Domain of unknown function (DUF4173)
MSAFKETAPDHFLFRLLGSLVLAVAACDVCFWDIRSYGSSVAVFFIVLATAILANRTGWRRRAGTRLVLGLMAGTAVATVVETGPANTIVWLVLIIALAGDTFFAGAETIWGRWLSQAVALLRAPGRVFWLAGSILKTLFSQKAGTYGGLAGAGLVLMPTAILALIFGSLLATGNAIFGLWTRGFFSALWKMLEAYLDPWRLALWFWIAFLVLPLLRPVEISRWWWEWTQRLPRWKGLMPRQWSVLSSAFALLTLNLLFLAANVADAIFLWNRNVLPAGVTYSQFVHEGVTSLTFTVLLSAVVLTLIFQQSLEIVRHRGLKFLALFWIVQNLFLILSVALRLMRYIEAYDMTVARLGVFLFLILVALGYGFLAGKVVYDRSLSWLLGACILSAFGVLYVTQFLNLAGWSADYNVARWEKDRTRQLDILYLQQLGPAAWPALERAHREASENRDLENALDSSVGPFMGVPFSLKYWREWSVRAQLSRPRDY